MKYSLLLLPFLLFLLIATAHTPAPVYASTTASSTLDTQLSANNSEIAQLNQEIANYEAQLQKIGSNKATLEIAIQSLNLKKREVEAQIALTQKQIKNTQVQLQQLGSQITTTQELIVQNKSAIAAGIRNIAQEDSEPLVLLLLSSDTLAQAWSDASAITQVQGAIEGKILNLGQQENTLTASQQASQQKKSVLVSQKQTLTSQQQSLTQTKQSQVALLAETNAQESTYQKLLAQAKAELASFSAFTQNAGGAGLLENQTSCDSWGCYYNQRDSQWGNDSLNGTEYLLKSDGCLVTSMAMVMTHYGYRDVTPVTINSNPNNFAAYYPAYLLYTINVDGVTATRKSSLIDSTLAAGNPVVVGLHAYGGTHFVVLVSGSRGDYLMRDPYIPNGMDISFSAHYSLREIFGISRVIIS